MSKWKKGLFTGLGLIVLVAIGVVTWSNWSIKADESIPDPAVTLANEIAADDIKYQEGYVGEAGTRIHYVSAGEGDPIIFAHGFPSYWFTMFTLMEEFKSDYRVIAFDGLGVGKSDAPGSVNAYKLEELTRAIDLLVTELDLGEVHLVGHDWGVTLVTGYARANPTKVKTVTTMAALPHNIIMSRVAEDEVHRELFSYTEYFSRANPSLILALGVKDQIWESSYAELYKDGHISELQAERLRKDMGSPRRLNRFIHWYRANMSDLENIEDSDFWPDRDIQLEVPTLLIYGSEDIVLTDVLIADFIANTDEMDVLELEGVGHRPHFEAYETVVSSIREFIERPRPMDPLVTQ